MAGLVATTTLLLEVFGVLAAFGTAVAVVAHVFGALLGNSLRTSAGTAAIVAVATAKYTVVSSWMALETRWARQAQEEAERGPRGDRAARRRNVRAHR